jgi:CheY-like chemotaxis protein
MCQYGQPPIVKWFSPATTRRDHFCLVLARAAECLDGLNDKAAILVVEMKRLYVSGSRSSEENGFSVLEAPNADAALELLESWPDVKLLFTDVQMPGSLTGMEPAREVHARWPHILSVITSGRERPRRIEMVRHRAWTISVRPSDFDRENLFGSAKPG